MKKYLCLLVFTMIVFACGHKKASLTGNDKIELSDFLESFPDVQPPYEIADSIFDDRAPDSLIMGYQAFTQFVPDSVIAKQFGKNTSVRFLPLARFKAGKNESYLFVEALTPAKKWAYVIGLDKSNKFITARTLFSAGPDGVQSSSAVMDSRFTLTIVHQRRSAAGDMLYRRDSYALNREAGKFLLILTESNEPTTVPRQILNPIDTLPKKHRLSGDYIQDKANFITVRDGHDASHLIFFVHFEKNDGDCKGELKGEAKIISPGLAHYTSAGDPCTLNFSFTPTHVVMKELEGCGSHRDIKCFFEGVFVRQKEIKKKIVKKPARVK